GSAVPSVWEHFTFAPAGLGQIVSTDPAGPGLPDWPIDLKDQGGQLLATTKTDAHGNYVFRGLANGTYIVAEAPQSGWTQTPPPAPGTYTITLTGSQVATGADFGNVDTVTTDRPPVFDTTPPAFGQVGQRYVYAAHASDPDHDVLTYDLPVPVAG